MQKIFVSYKREDKEQVEPIVAELRSRDFDIWWDQDIPPEAPWEDTIEKHLAEASIAIVFWSQLSKKSENVKAEAREARKKEKLLQIFIDETDPPLFFGERQGIDFSDGDPEKWSKAFEALNSYLIERLDPELKSHKDSAENAPDGALTVLEILGWLMQDELRRLCRALDVTPPNWRTKADMAAAIAEAINEPEPVVNAMRGRELSSILWNLGKRSTGLSIAQMKEDVLSEF